MSFIRKTPGLIGSTSLSKPQSSHHASVTIFEASSKMSSESSRRSNRLQSHSSELHQSSIAEESSSTKFEPDIEDADTHLELKKSNKLVKSSRKRKETISSTAVSPRKAKAIRLSLDEPHPPPKNWRQTYDAIKEMRKDGGAPVDEMGCHMAGGPVNDPKTKRFVTLVSLMLSSQTKDEVTHQAVLNLRSSLGELTVENVIAADQDTISKAICKVGFWRRKTLYIKQAAQKIQDDFEGEIPNTVDGLCSLPGVGPKMAFLALQVAWNLNKGIGVDVHVHRITNRLGWHKPPTKDPEQTRLNLQSWLPTDLHGEINPLLVGLGQTICLPVGPRCDMCTLSATGLCPSAKAVKSTTRRTTVKKAAFAKVTVEVAESEEQLRGVDEAIKIEVGVKVQESVKAEEC